jgi:D-alanine-D-alanine ligase
MTTWARRCQHPADFGRVAVLYGGTSAEREVSLAGGRAVLEALHALGIEAQGVDTGDRSWAAHFLQGSFERAFIMLHGRGGEDGTIQGFLEQLGIPYTGSDGAGCAFTMDKVRCKQLWLAQGLPTAPLALPESGQEGAATVARLGLPLAIKPAREGSTIGVSRIDRLEDFARGYALARQQDERVLVEPWLQGQELTVAMLHAEALPVVRIEAPGGWYGYEAKYHSDETRYFCPAGLGEDMEGRARTLATSACRACDVVGWARVDMILDAAHRLWLLEVNTVPGMTNHSLVPMAAKAAGLDFPELCWLILESSLS